MRRLPVWLATLAAAAVLAGLGAPAAAQESLTLDEVGPGSCTPDPVAPGATTDCTFDLDRRAPLSPDGGPYVLEGDGPTGTVVPTCHVEGAQLRCPDVRVNAAGPDGDRTLSATLVFGDRRRPDAVTVEVADVHQRARLRIAEHSVVTPSVPLRYATPQDLPDRTWLQVTRRYDTEVVTTLEVETTGGWDAEPIAVPADHLGLGAGSYRLRLCLGRTAQTCRPSGWSTALQVINEPLEPLVAGHDVPDADRINLVVAGYGFDDQRAFIDVATMALDPEAGLVVVDEDGTRLDRERAQQVAEAGQRVEIHFGFFAIAPFVDHVDQFNLWLLPEQLDHPASLRHVGGGGAPPWIDGFAVDGHVLGNVSVVTIAQDPPGVDPGSHAAHNALHEIEGPVERADDKFDFSGSTTWVGRDAPWRDVTTVAHELGHALFGLRDEYREPSSAVPHYGYPNCARSRDQAARWWGDMIGELDPMALRYRQVVEAYQPDLRDISDDLLAEWVAVDIHERPCGSAEHAPASFVPTQRGLMANELPILGAVNRARAEQVMRLFSGRLDDSGTTQPSLEPTPHPTTDGADPTSAPTATDDPVRTPTAVPSATPRAAPNDESGSPSGWPVLLMAATGLLLAAGGLWVRRRRREPSTRSK